MVSLDLVKNSSPHSSSGALLQDEKPTLSFSDLLMGIADKKDDKAVQNGALLLSLNAEEESVK
ncbi:MAG: flagellar hook-length control protein FliK, partial [Campylobacterota bacterium]|nr:flagellar hook-length control protein FliK [Campylobacterota bacterium]